MIKRFHFLLLVVALITSLLSSCTNCDEPRDTYKVKIRYITGKVDTLTMLGEPHLDGMKLYAGRKSCKTEVAKFVVSFNIQEIKSSTNGTN